MNILVCVYKHILLSLLLLLFLLLPANAAHVYLNKFNYKRSPVDTRLYAPDPPATHHVLMGIKYFDESSQNDEVAEVSIDLYGTVVPRTVTNFVELCKGIRLLPAKLANDHNSEFATYKKAQITSVIKNKVICSGYVCLKGAFTKYGPTMKDENFALKHDRPGRVSSMNRGVPDSNDSRFFFSMDPNEASKYDGKNVVFGQVVHGLDALQRLQDNVAVDEEGTPLHEVVIEYVIVDTVTSEYFEKFHGEYLEKLERFQNGDTSVGVHLQQQQQQQQSVSSVKNILSRMSSTEYGEDYLGYTLRLIVLLFGILCIVNVGSKIYRGRMLVHIRGLF